MLVDLGRNDVGRVSRPGTVKVEEREVIERYCHVMHMVSQVSGTLDPGLDAWDVIAAAFPAGTVSGAPKVRALEIIDELEPVSRGPYAGAVGYVGFDGDMDLAIVIRSVALQRPAAALPGRRRHRARLHARGRVPGDGAQAPRRPGGHRRRRGGPVILVVDNYDSFTFNLVQASRRSAPRSRSTATTRSTWTDVRAMKPEAVVLSPGPCTPDEAGISVPLIQALSGTVPILGVCLGHQSIGAAFGGTWSAARAGSCTGRPRPCSHAGTGLFTGLPRRCRSAATTRWWSTGATLPEVLRGHRGVDRRRRDHGAPPPHASDGRACSSTRSACSRPDGPALLRNFLAGAARAMKAVLQKLRRPGGPHPGRGRGARSRPSSRARPRPAQMGAFLVGAADEGRDAGGDRRAPRR